MYTSWEHQCIALNMRVDSQCGVLDAHPSLISSGDGVCCGHIRPNREMNARAPRRCRAAETECDCCSEPPNGRIGNCDCSQPAVFVLFMPFWKEGDSGHQQAASHIVVGKIEVWRVMELVDRCLDGRLVLVSCAATQPLRASDQHHGGSANSSRDPSKPGPEQR